MREGLGLTVSALSRVLGCHRDTLRYWELPTDDPHARPISGPATTLLRLLDDNRDWPDWLMERIPTRASVDR